MVDEKRKDDAVYGMPSTLDINRCVLSLIHAGRISENFTPDYDTIVAKYTKLALLKNIKTTVINDSHNYPCNQDLLKEVISSTDRFT